MASVPIPSMRTASNSIRSTLVRQKAEIILVFKESLNGSLICGIPTSSDLHHTTLSTQSIYTRTFGDSASELSSAMSLTITSDTYVGYQRQVALLITL